MQTFLTKPLFTTISTNLSHPSVNVPYVTSPPLLAIHNNSLLNLPFDIPWGCLRGPGRLKEGKMFVPPDLLLQDSQSSPSIKTLSPSTRIYTSLPK
jgi:hypothetical protein